MAQPIGPAPNRVEYDDDAAYAADLYDHLNALMTRKQDLKELLGMVTEGDIRHREFRRELHSVKRRLTALDTPINAVLDDNPSAVSLSDLATDTAEEAI